MLVLATSIIRVSSISEDSQYWYKDSTMYELHYIQGAIRNVLEDTWKDCTPPSILCRMMLSRPWVTGLQWLECLAYILFNTRTILASGLGQTPHGSGILLEYARKLLKEGRSGKAGQGKRKPSIVIKFNQIASVLVL